MLHPRSRPLRLLLLMPISPIRHPGRLLALLMPMLVALALPAIAPAQALQGLTICIDAGHGGQGSSQSYTGGHVGPGGLTESRATLEMALLLRERLRRHGAQVVMTRTRDRRVTPEGSTAEQELDARWQMARDARADYLLSLHLSYHESDPTANVTRVFYTAPHEDTEIALGSIMGRRLAQRLGTRFTQPEAHPYRVIAPAPMPAIVIEISSLSNPEEERRLGRLSYAQLASEVMADAFIEHIQSRGRPPQAPPQPARPSPTPVAQPAPPAPSTPSPAAPAATTVAPTAAPVAPSPAPTRSTTGAGPQFVPHEPILLNPVGGRLDQAWLYGETYHGLPLQTGVSFDVPEDTLVLAAAAGLVEIVVPRGTTAPAALVPDVVNYDGIVILRHDAPTLEGQPLWTVYGRLADTYVAPGEHVARGAVLGKTQRPYDGSPASRQTAFQFEVRMGRNVVHRTVNPSPLIDRPDGLTTGMVALEVLDPAGLPVANAEVRGIVKGPGFRRYGFSLTYARGVNPHPVWSENLLICDVPPGMHDLRVRGEAIRLEVRPGMLTRYTWQLRRPQGE